jgi:hypothetical protein
MIFDPPCAYSFGNALHSLRIFILCVVSFIRFYLRAGHPPAAPGLPPGIVHVPCRVFDASPEQREILLGRKHRNVRVEAAGRLSRHEQVRKAWLIERI